MSKLFVSNISWNTSEEELHSFFEEVGQVLSTKIVLDRATGRSRGFGFVEMESPDMAEKAVSELNGLELGGRELRVSPFVEKERSRYGSRY